MTTATASQTDVLFAELAASTGTAERCARERLEQQAVAGILSVADPDAACPERRWGPPPAHSDGAGRQGLNVSEGPRLPSDDRPPGWLMWREPSSQQERA
jgi:hypothetical protein